MAQIWLTYEELGDFCGCTPFAARNLVVENNWSRRRSGDGLTRVKLPQILMRDYIGRMAANWQGRSSPEIETHRSSALPGLVNEDVRVLNSSASGDIDHDEIADRMAQSLRAALPDSPLITVQKHSA